MPTDQLWDLIGDGCACQLSNLALLRYERLKERRASNRSAMKEVVKKFVSKMRVGKKLKQAAAEMIERLMDDSNNMALSKEQRDGAHEELELLLEEVLAEIPDEGDRKLAEKITPEILHPGDKTMWFSMKDLFDAYDDGDPSAPVAGTSSSTALINPDGDPSAPVAGTSSSTALINPDGDPSATVPDASSSYGLRKRKQSKYDLSEVDDENLKAMKKVADGDALEFINKTLDERKQGSNPDKKRR